MYPQRIFKELAPLLAALLTPGVIAGALLLRAPVVVVSDKYYAALYGEKRETAKALENSVLLLRRVRIFEFPGEADSKAAVLALQNDFPRPYCVVFPYRYAQAGALYAEEEGASPAFILEERNTHRPAAGKAVYIPSAWRSDFYLAGRLSALLAAAPEDGGDDDDENASFRPHPLHRAAGGKTHVLLLTQDNPENETLAAFEAGLTAGGWTGELSVLSHVSSTQLAATAAAALVGSISSFTQHQAAEDTPCVLFSSAPMDVFPEYIKAVIDDSVWVLLPGIVRQAGAPPGADNTGLPVAGRLKSPASARSLGTGIYLQLLAASVFNRE